MVCLDDGDGINFGFLDSYDRLCESKIHEISILINYEYSESPVFHIIPSQAINQTVEQLKLGLKCLGI